MSEAALGLSMLGLIVVVIMLGFPTAFTLMGLGMFFGFIAFYDPAAPLARQPGLRPDGAARLRRDDQRDAAVDPAVRADGLRDGARRAGRQDVPQRAARVPPRARLAGGHDADRLHLLGHRQRPGRRGGRADGRDRDAADAERRLRHAAGRRRDHRRRHAGHPDPALGDDHRLRRGGRTVGGQAVRGGDVPGLLPGLPLPDLRDRLGHAAAEGRAQAAARAAARPDLAVGRPRRGQLFAAHAAGLADGGAAPGTRPARQGRRRQRRAGGCCCATCSPRWCRWRWPPSCWAPPGGT